MSFVSFINHFEAQAESADAYLPYGFWPVSWKRHLLRRKHEV